MKIKYFLLSFSLCSLFLWSCENGTKEISEEEKKEIIELEHKAHEVDSVTHEMEVTKDEIEKTSKNLDSLLSKI